MQLKHWLMRFMAASLVLLSSCGSGPKLKICVSRPASFGFECYDERTEKGSFLPYSESDKYIAVDAVDGHTLFNYCGLDKPKREQ